MYLTLSQPPPPKQTYDASREGRDEDEDDENEEYDDVEEQAYVLFKLEVSSTPSSSHYLMGRVHLGARMH